MKNNPTKGAISTGAIFVIIAALLILIGGAYWYSSATTPAPGSEPQATTTPGADTTGATSGGQPSKVTDNAAKGTKNYTNFKYGYVLEFANDVQNNISTPENVIFSIDNGTSTDATLAITVANDVTHLAYCLTVPQGAKSVATTTINGAKFLSYAMSTSAAANSGTTYYRALHTGPYGEACYDMQKAPQGSASANAKLQSVINSFEFGAF